LGKNVLLGRAKEGKCKEKEQWKENGRKGERKRENGKLWGKINTKQERLKAKRARLL
jgi:hypothetical protein